MNKKLEKIRNVIAVMLALLALGCANYYLDRQRDKSLRNQIRDLQVQLARAQTEMKTDTIRDSIPVVTQQAVIIDKTDYKKQIADRQLIKDLNLQLKQVEAENRMLLATLDSVSLNLVHDSILVYHDDWADFMVNTKTRSLQYEVRDSVVTLVTSIPKHRFLWWRWGTKGYDVRLVNFNPHSRVVYNRYVLVNN